MSDETTMERVEGVKPTGKAIDKKEKIPWSLGKKARVAVAGTLIAGVLGYGGYEAANDFRDIPIPALHQTKDVPSVFDPSALKSQIDANNSIQMTLSEYEKIAPPVWQEENKTLTSILPIKFRDNRIPMLHIEKAINPYVNYNVPYVMTIDGLQTGDIIISPMDGIIETDGGNGKGVVGAFFLDGKGPHGERLSMTFATTDLNLLIYPTPQPQNIKVSTPIKMGDPIGSLLTSDRHRMFAGQIQISGRGPLIESFDLASTSEGKAIVLK